MFLSFLTVGAIVASLGLVSVDNTKNVTSDSYSLEQLSAVANAIDESFNVTGFEKKLSVSIEESDLNATLYDFNDDEGYMLLGDNYQIFDFKAGVDLLPEYKYCDDLVFNNVSKTYKNAESNKTSNVDLTGERQEDIKNEKNGASYSHGEGKIESYELQSYLNEYFSGSTLDSYYSVSMRRNLQYDISIYYKGTSSEGNCWLCASYTGLSHLMFDSVYSTSMYGGFKSKKNTVIYNPKTQELNTYNFAKSKNYTPCDGASGNPSMKSVTTLYRDLRKKSLSYDYKAPIEGLTIDNTVKAINNTMKDYGCSIRAVKDTNYNAYTGTEAFKDYFRAGKVALFDTDGGTYGQHLMAVSGFRHYRREKQFLFWSYTEWKTFLEVGDGHSTSVRYFDITRYFQDMRSGSFINFNL